VVETAGAYTCQEADFGGMASAAEDAMEIHWMRRPEAGKTKTKDAARCTQCGEHLDLERIRLLAGRADGTMCRDCAFDAPCTD
jgi:hypothetical protein